MSARFLRPFLIYGMASAISKFLGFFLTPIYTRIFTPADYGTIDLLSAFVYILCVFSALEIWSGVTRDYAAAVDPVERATLVSTGLWAIAGGSFIMMGIGILIAGPIGSTLLGMESDSATYLLAMATVPTATLFSYLNVLMRFEDRPWQFLVGIMLQSLLTASVTLGAILIYGMGVKAFFFGQLIGNAVGVGFFAYLLRRHIRPIINARLLLKICAFSVPIVPAVLGIWLNNYSNRFVLLKYLSIDDIGIYAVALKVSSIFLFIEYAFRLAWTPFFYEMINAAGYELRLRAIFSRVLWVLTLMVMLVSMFSREIIAFLAPANYQGGNQVAGILCVPAILLILSQIVGVGSLIARKTIYDSISNIAGMVVNVASLFVTIPAWGILGAAISSVAGALTTFSLYWYFSWQLTRLQFPIGQSVVLLGVATLVAAIVGLVPLPLAVRLAGGVSVVIGGVISLWRSDVVALKPLLKGFRRRVD